MAATPPLGQHGAPYSITGPVNQADRANLERIASLMIVAEAGRPVYQCDLFDDLVVRDMSLYSLVKGRVDALAGKPIAVLAGGSGSDDARAADAFREVLGRLDLDSLIQWHQYSALVHGWGATELDWQWNPDDRRWDPGGWWHLRSRQFRVATEIYRIVPDASPEELLVQTGPSQEQVARLTPDKWVVTRHAPWLRITRSGLMHVCARYAVLRTQSWAHWFAFLRRYGIPALQIEIASWSDAAQQAQAEDMLKRWGEDVGFVTDASGKVKASVVDGAQASRSATSDPQARFVEAVRGEFAALWTGIPAGASQGGVGNYYTGKAYSGIRADMLEADARRICGALREQLIKPWMRFNGFAGEAPRLDIRLADRIQDPETVVKTAGELARMGYEVDAAQLEEITGLRIKKVNAVAPASAPIPDTDVAAPDDE
jgi:phage gp29-like protein